MRPPQQWHVFGKFFIELLQTFSPTLNATWMKLIRLVFALHFVKSLFPLLSQSEPAAFFPTPHCWLIWLNWWKWSLGICTAQLLLLWFSLKFEPISYHFALWHFSSATPPKPETIRDPQARLPGPYIHNRGPFKIKKTNQLEKFIQIFRCESISCT